MEKRVLQLSINDKIYTIASDENVEQLNQAAKMVDELYRDIAAKTKFNDGNKIAVLTALQLAFDLVKKQTDEKFVFKKLESLTSLLGKEVI